MKFGLDIHGVINEKPEFWQKFAKTIIKAGGEIHIISGPPKEQITEELKKLWLMGGALCYTHIFSIVDYHKELSTSMQQDSEGNWHLDHYLWDRTKADYCLNHQIDLMIDDSDAYNYFFKTPYARFFSKNKRTWHVNPDNIIDNIIEENKKAISKNIVKSNLSLFEVTYETKIGRILESCFPFLFKKI